MRAGVAAETSLQITVVCAEVCRVRLSIVFESVLLIRRDGANGHRLQEKRIYLVSYCCDN